MAFFSNTSPALRKCTYMKALLWRRSLFFPTSSSSSSSSGKSAVVPQWRWRFFSSASQVEEGRKAADVAAAQLPRVHSPSLDEFTRDWFEPQRPVVIESAMENWKARKWTVDTLAEQFGQTTIHVELSRWNGKERRWADFRDLYKNRELLPKEELFIPQHPILLQEFVDIFLRNHEDQSSPLKGYLAQQQLFNELPALAEGIEDPEYAKLGGGIYQRNVWLGPAGTITPLHRDPYHNVLAQVWGSKHIRLFSPNESEKLYPFKTNLYLRNTSEVDVDAEDALTRWPNLQNAVYFECLLNAGEMIFIPKKWWHYVKSQDTSFSVSFWFL